MCWCAPYFVPPARPQNEFQNADFSLVFPPFIWLSYKIHTFGNANIQYLVYLSSFYSKYYFNVFFQYFSLPPAPSVGSAVGPAAAGPKRGGRG